MWPHPSFLPRSLHVNIEVCPTYSFLLPGRFGVTHLFLRAGIAGHLVPRRSGSTQRRPHLVALASLGSAAHVGRAVFEQVRVHVR